LIKGRLGGVGIAREIAREEIRKPPLSFPPFLSFLSFPFLSFLFHPPLSF